MSDTFNLDRQMNVEQNIDALGKKWEVIHIKGSALFEARPNPYNAMTEIPDEFKGRWTKPDLLDKQIKLWVNRSWDMAEREALKKESKARTQAKKDETKAKNAEE